MIDDVYRLWLTSMPSTTFPVPVLQSGIKITNEPPKGMRANLGRTFQDITPDMYEVCTSKPREFKKLLFALAFFHAAILERRKFGPIGWNIPYEWMDSDFQVSYEQVNMYLSTQPGVPWITLNYIIAEVNYGGRVTDDKDVRLIKAILVRYLNEGILTDGYKLSPLPEYYCPPEGGIEEVREYVGQLPMDEDPQVFGLHPNAMITAETSQAKVFMDTVISVQPRVGGGGGGKTPQEIVLDMVREFAKVVPESMNKRDAHPDTYRQTEEGGMISLGVFHGQETDRFNDLISKVKLSFAMLDKAIQGLVVMSADYEEMFNAFLIQSTPKMWSKVTYPCLKPLNSWMVDFVDRIAFMRRWLVGGAPASFWVPCFYFPQGFMTAAMQVHARKTKIPIDTLKFWSEPTLIEDGTSDDVQPQENGVNIHGMFLQGCGWNFAGQQLKESDKDILFVLIPVLWLNPVLNSEFAEKMKSSTRYECPLYKTSERKGTLSTTGHSTNWITWFQLPTDMSDQAHWIRRGVALLCMLDD